MCCMALPDVALSLKQAPGKGPSLFTMISCCGIMPQSESISERVSLIYETLRETESAGTADLSLLPWSHSSSELGMQCHFKCAASGLTVGQSF